MQWVRFRPRALSALASVALLGTGVPSAIAAQQPLLGVVRDSLGDPVPDAEVFLLKRDQPVRTDSHGQFRLDDVQRGEYWVFVRKLGYAPARQSISVQNQERARALDVVLRVPPRELDAVMVSAASGYGSGEGPARWFSDDVKAWGQLLTRDRIARSRAPLLSVLLQQYFPGAPMDAHERHRAMLEQGNLMLVGRHPQTCFSAISINGGSPEIMDPDLLPIDQIEAVELFLTGVGSPKAVEMMTPPGACGFVAVWLRDVAG